MAKAKVQPARSVFDEPNANNLPMPTASTLLSMASGMIQRGADKCFFCGGPCDKNTAARREAHQPAFKMPPGRAFQPVTSNSRVICDGCLRSIRKCTTVPTPGFDKAGNIPFFDRNEPRPYEMANMLDFSFLLTEKKYFACKRPRDTAFITHFLCNPPKDVMWSAVLSDTPYSYLHRGKVNRPGENEEFRVTLNGDIIEYTPLELKRRIEMSEKVAIGIMGCNSLAESEKSVDAKFEGGGEMFKAYLSMREEPETRLAGWLCREISAIHAGYSAAGK